MKPFICPKCGKETFSLTSGEYSKRAGWGMVCDDCYSELSCAKDRPYLSVIVNGGSKWPIKDVAETMRISPEEAQARRDRGENI